MSDIRRVEKTQRKSKKNLSAFYVFIFYPWFWGFGEAHCI